MNNQNMIKPEALINNNEKPPVLDWEINQKESKTKSDYEAIVTIPKNADKKISETYETIKSLLNSLSSENKEDVEKMITNLNNLEIQNKLLELAKQKEALEKQIKELKSKANNLIMLE